MKQFDWGKYKHCDFEAKPVGKDHFNKYYTCTPKVDESIYHLNHKSVLFVFSEGSTKECNSPDESIGLRSHGKRPIGVFVPNSIDESYLTKGMPTVLSPGSENNVIMSKVGRVVSFDLDDGKLYYLISSFNGDVFKVHKEGHFNCIV